MFNYTSGVILMTALIPTKGHLELIKFAHKYLSNESERTKKISTLEIVLSSRSFEPIDGNDRVNSLFDFIRTLDTRSCSVNVIHHMNDDTPQNPPDHPDFWGWWRDTILEKCQWFRLSKEKIIFASEIYGIQMAKVLNAKFIPFDVKREFINIKGTNVRIFLQHKFNEIAPTFQPYLRKTITLFGCESVGKTTTAKNLAREFNGLFVPEWARQYLETVGQELDYDKMITIANSQYVLQQNAFNRENYFLIFQDTDLLSTIGYFRLLGMKVPDYVIENFLDTKSDLYILMSSKIPFEPNILRYGGNKRETEDIYWINLLEEFNCNYITINSSEFIDRDNDVSNNVNDFINEICEPIRFFVRT